ncbi:hypothetical protein TRICI_003731 [Trichomonascus ciferrii]|uniref:Ribosome maturation protein SDO1/SBDS N-terminal domain-containing protein n=1 Tax=Trichomonascus ciferrii TaxID=44093 RepID=A0A642V2G4_9ASCO|nr:hypothetical protein TRICI_003731 [Trichomonascus ciferrii]
MGKDVQSDQAVIFYHTDNEDFIVWASSKQDLERWRNDSSVPLVEVVQLFKVFCTMKQGSQGVYHEASHSQLDNAFGTHDEDEVIKKILKEGDVQIKTLKGDEAQNNFKNR